jgi:Vacuolar-sorting-associated 13 protein C-terminal/Autophagy-related protein C terminal domain
VIAIDLAFLVRLQRFFMGLQDHFQEEQYDSNLGLRSGSSGIFSEQKKAIPFPAFDTPEKELEKVAAFSENMKMYFQGLTILPTNIKLSVAPARALTSDQAALEGKEAAAIHEAVRKGDVLLGTSSGPLGVRVGRKNRTPLAVVRGVFKSIVVDALLRLDGASLNFPGVFLRNHIATGSQLTTYLTAHYVNSLKHNVPALLGSLAAIGNPLGLIRGIGDGVSDFVTEPVKGFKRSLKELDPGYVVDGVARGTESLARHTVGGLADSASLLTETFSKYMAVVTLDRRYAQKRDRGRSLRLKGDSRVTLASGVESGFLKLVQGFREGVTGVVKAPLRGAEKRGFQGFAKGLGKGLLGLLVKPIIGISDAATDFMIGVKSTVEYKEEYQQNLALLRNQLRPRRAMYGRDKVLRPYRLEDAAAATLMLRTRCAGENYLGHLDMGDRVALLSVKRLIILGPLGEEQLALKYIHVERIEVRSIQQEDGGDGWGIVVVLNTPRRNGGEVEVITCQSQEEAIELCSSIQRGLDLASSESIQA